MKIALVAGCAAAAVASAKPPIQTLHAGAKIDPISMRGVKLVDGKLIATTDWIAYEGGFNNRQIPSGCLYDSFGRDWTLAATGLPQNNAACIADGSRYFFGLGYAQPFGEEDNAQHRTSIVTEIDLGWQWEGAGADCFVLVVCGDGNGSFLGCTNMTAGSGVVLNYGPLATGNGYYYSNVDMTTFTAPFSNTSNMQYAFGNAYDGTTFTLANHPVQPMLWGGPGNLVNDSPATIMPGSFGRSDNGSIDDGWNVAPDGVLTADECADFDFGPGLCADFLGKMFAFGGCSVDFDGDGFPTGDDFDAYVAAFEAGDISADFDGDGFVTGDDFDAYVALFELGC